MSSLSTEWRSSGIMQKGDCSLLLRLPSVAQWRGTSAASLSGPITYETPREVAAPTSGSS